MRSSTISASKIELIKNKNESQIGRSTAGALHVVGFVKKINMKEGSSGGKGRGR